MEGLQALVNAMFCIDQRCRTQQQRTCTRQLARPHLVKTDRDASMLNVVETSFGRMREHGCRGRFVVSGRTGFRRSHAVLGVSTTSSSCWGRVYQTRVGVQMSDSGEWVVRNDRRARHSAQRRDAAMLSESTSMKRENCERRGRLRRGRAEATFGPRAPRAARAPKPWDDALLDKTTNLPEMRSVARSFDDGPAGVERGLLTAAESGQVADLARARGN